MSGNEPVPDNLILGLGRTGLACARYFAARGEAFAVLDNADRPAGLGDLMREFPAVPVYLGPFDAQLLCRARRIVLSPGVPRALPAIRAALDHGVNVVGDIELFLRQTTVPVIGITGSNGKSTVATLVHEMIRRAGVRSTLAGNIGRPVLELVDEPAPDYYVLELSSFQLESVSALNAAAAVVLNVTPDHMDRYADLAGYAAAKARVYSGAGIMVLNRDDATVAAMAQPDRSCRYFTLDMPGTGEFGLVPRAGGAWLACGGEALLPAAGLRLTGTHNLANALAALALCSAIGLPPAPLLDTLRSFPGLPHRCQWVARQDGVDWYDDSKGTNVGASCSAIEGLALDRQLILIAGGIGKGADFSPLAQSARGRVRAALLIGRDAPVIAGVLRGVVPVYTAADMEDAVRRAARLARDGDAVLLSPACASFDMFQDYADRGRAFIEAVQGLREGAAS